MTTEIYSCKEGQSLKQGKLDYNASITTKDEAASDALRRCQRDPTLKKIAYYKVSPDGEFRVFYSYTNPNCKPAGSAGAAGPAKPRPAVKKAPPPKLGFFGKLKKALGL
ncbi:MAG TPA: hypothetical protein VKP60_20675 [Magnetospirillaceae bacterium]|nr:hypothetical protein [Magnetospirillaceae bacterium]